MSTDSRSPAPGSQTLARGLRTLMLVAEAPDGLSGAEVARLLGVHQSIAYRMLQTLVQSDIVRRDSDNRYRVGLSTLRLAHSATGGLRSIARPILEVAAADTGCSAWLFLESDDDAVAVLTVEPGPFSNSSRFIEGSRHPLNRGAAGYALLSLRPPSPSDPPAVIAAREFGYAISHGEIASDAWGLAAPLTLDTGSIRSCVNLAGRSKEQVLAAVPALLIAVKKLAEVIDQT